LLLDIDILAGLDSSAHSRHPPEVKEEDIVVTVSSPEEEEDDYNDTEIKKKTAKVYKTHVDQKRRKKPHGLLFKLAVTLLAIVIVLLPYVLAYLCSSLLSNPTAYIVTKNETSREEMVISAIRSQMLNSFKSGIVIGGTAVVCDAKTQEQAGAFFDPLVLRNRSQVLVVDLENYKCLHQLADSDFARLDQLMYAGLVLLDQPTNRSSSPHPAGPTKMAAITNYPVLTVNSADVKVIPFLSSEVLTNVLNIFQNVCPLCRRGYNLKRYI
jgi:hypothetical protein